MVVVAAGLVLVSFPPGYPPSSLLPVQADVRSPVIPLLSIVVVTQREGCDQALPALLLSHMGIRWSSAHNADHYNLTSCKRSHYEPSWSRVKQSVLVENISVSE